MALDHNAVVTELWRRINEALTIPLQTAATAASDALLAQIAAEAARDEALGVKQYVDDELEKKAPLEHRHTSEQIDGLDDTLNTAMTTKADITYVDDEVAKKADKSHTHTSADLTDVTDAVQRNSSASGNRLVKTRNDGMLYMPHAPSSSTHPANKAYVDNQDSIQFLKDRSGNTHIWDLPESAVSQTSNDIVVRGSDGVIHQTILPDDDSHVANKQYVDAMAAAEIIARNLSLVEKADVSHQHSIADVTARNGTTTSYDLPASNTSTTVNHIVVRTTSGRIRTANPSAYTDAANKQYVDGLTPWIGSQAAYNSLIPTSGRLYVIT